MNYVTYNNVNNVQNGRLCIPMFDVKDIKEIDVRTEGFCNWDYTIKLSDNSEIHLNSIDGERPLFYDESLKEEIIVSDELWDFLLNLPQPELSGEGDEYTVELEYTLFYQDGKQVNFKITLEDYA